MSPTKTQSSDRSESDRSEIEQLKKRISSLEEKLLRVSNIYRYETLQNLLKEGKWLEADKETVRLILAIAGQAEIENLRPSEIEHIDCSELQVIDRLWLTYSDNRFGFSLQVKMYQDVGGNEQTTIEQNTQLIEKWGDRLGWRQSGQWLKCSDLNYSEDAAKGSLPGLWWNSPYGSKMTNYFLARLMNCNL
ncbi:GUN4 domain-containing protein [Pleurocapsa sp. PCC 7319]|uniref:GUN4 domain-containing protein n=1 Tax=Pleurocapsa sp. PCC 7319 TaxID=118161 RepID=UPI00034A43B5|nr:GUN4 domain-containing protein [Pleurocapsa sp. PCC 7319]